MLVTELGMMTDFRDEQFENASSAMLVTVSGMVKLSPFDKYEISVLLSEVYRFPSNIVKCLEQLTTFAGQSIKGFPLILVTELGMVKDLREEQLPNAP